MEKELPAENESKTVEIQIAIPADAAGITNVHVTTWLATYPNEAAGITYESIKRRVAGEHNEKIDEKIEKWRKSIETQGETHAIFVAKIDSEVVGFVGPRFDKEHRRRLGAFYVLPTVQRQGIGSKLLHKAFEWHGDTNDIYLHVATYNQPAINFYERFGFEKTDKPVTDDIGRTTGEVEIPEIEMVRKAPSPTTKYAARRGGF